MNFILKSQSQELQTERYVQKVDSFIIVLDSSSSMGTIYEDEVARTIFPIYDCQRYS